ncbi:MAG: helix-turn-helix domain-containing protein [Oscillospiraceae bacterium]|jgi:two-component system response regulator YesN|nr:helix-turn-helix domain-containing protein [Oscillospiraceae bacterium]
MYRILVVDDERTIADSIYYLLLRQTQWETEVLRTYDGESAWELLTHCKADLIISDICMPGLDGLALARNVRKAWPQCQIIFLTGYRNFEHAYEALQLGNVRYLLKTSDYDQLLALMTESLAAVDELRARFTQQTLLQAQINMAFSLLRNDLCEHLLQGKMPGVAVMDELAFDIDLGRSVLMMLYRMPPLPKEQDAAWKTDHAQKLFLHFLYRLLLDHDIQWFYGERDGALICLLQPRTLTGTAMKELQGLVWESLSDMQALIEQQTGQIPTMLFSREPVSVADVPELYQDMMHAAAQYAAQGAILKIAMQEPAVNIQRAVRHAIRYIYRHYTEDVSLLSLADAVHMNTAYFSRLFKKETGKSFVDFLNNVRMEAACRLLRDTYMKVSEIAEATGFGTPKYFHVVFKRYLHTTPAQWRDQLGKAKVP